jgi:hypothetical protein
MMIKLIKNKKGITWEFIAKAIIWLVALAVLIYIIAKAAQNSNVIIEKIKEIF